MLSQSCLTPNINQDILPEEWVLCVIRNRTQFKWLPLGWVTSSHWMFSLNHMPHTKPSGLYSWWDLTNTSAQWLITLSSMIPIAQMVKVSQGREGNCYTAGELQDLKEAAFLSSMGFLQLETPFSVLKGVLLWVYQICIFENRYYTKLILDLLPHLDSGILSPGSPTFSPLPDSDMPPPAWCSSWYFQWDVTSLFESCCLWSSRSFTGRWNYLALSLIRAFHPLLPSTCFVLPGTVPAHHRQHTFVQWIESELNSPWQGPRACQRTLGGGKVVNRGEFLYTDYFTLFVKGQSRFLLSPQRTEAGGMMNRSLLQYPNSHSGCLPRKGEPPQLLSPLKYLNKKESRKHLKLPLGKLFCLWFFFFFQNVFKWFGSIFNTRETWCCKES